MRGQLAQGTSKGFASIVRFALTLLDEDGNIVESKLFAENP